MGCSELAISSLLEAVAVDSTTIGAAVDVAVDFEIVGTTIGVAVDEAVDFEFDATIGAVVDVAIEFEFDATTIGAAFDVAGGEIEFSTSGNTI